MLNFANNIEIIVYNPLDKKYSPTIKSLLLSNRYERNFKKLAIDYITTTNILFL